MIDRVRRWVRVATCVPPEDVSTIDGLVVGAWLMLVGIAAAVVGVLVSGGLAIAAGDVTVAELVAAITAAADEPMTLSALDYVALAVGYLQLAALVPPVLGLVAVAKALVGREGFAYDWEE
jgi:hypothetical protein